MEEVHTAVVGAGVTGLCAAHYAAEKTGPDGVLVLEASDYLGGQTRTDRVDGFSCDWGPNGFLDREPRTLEWVKVLGIEDQLLRCDESAARRFVLKDERLHEVIGPPKFLLTPLLSLRGRARLCCEPLVPAKRDRTPESIWAFAARRIGREAADTMVIPMVSGVFGGDAKQLSLEHCFPRMAAMEREYGGLVRALMAIRKKDKTASPTGPRGTLTSFEGGIGFLAETAARCLGDRCRTNTRVTRISPSNGGYRLDTEPGGAVHAKCVIVALPAHAAAGVVAEMDGEASSALAAIDYADIAVVCVGYPREKVRHDLHGFGFLVPRNQGKRVLGCLWTSSIFPRRAPKGWVHLRAMYGGYTDSEAVRLSDNELLDALGREIHPLLGIDGPPEFVSIYRHCPGIPQYLLGHQARLDVVDAAEERHPGLVFAGNAYKGVGLNDCVLSAHRAIDQLKERGLL